MGECVLETKATNKKRRRAFTFQNVNSETNKERNHDVSKASLFGMIYNVILFVMKFTIGYIINSAAITGDAFNNLSDSGVSLFALIGLRKSSKGKDEEHPFGFGRVEYIFGLIISFLIFFTAIEVGKMSFRKLFIRELVEYNAVILAILGITIVVKLVFGFYTKSIANKTKSVIIQAISRDSLIDAAISGVTIMSMVLSKQVSFPIDGIIGFSIVIWIFISGCNLAEENINSIIGKKPDPELVEKITKIIKADHHITGYHNLIIHDYGQENYFVSVHLEIPERYNLPYAYQSIEDI
jgi:cation diffusion facilitator family transporter